MAEERSKEKRMSVPAYELEMIAEQQRTQLHDSISELRSQMRGRLKLKGNLRQYAIAASGILALSGLLAGYLAGGLFTDHKHTYRLVVRS
jgi:hypothetical protein